MGYSEIFISNGQAHIISSPSNIYILNDMITRSILRPSRLAPYTQTRSLVFVRQGKAIARGLKKDESDYMIASNGVTYPGNDKTLGSTKNLLGDNYKLPDSIILQAITHKSFAHGKKPFNEKLAILGNQFMRVNTFMHAVSTTSSNPNAIAGLNFDISLRVLELLSSTSVLSEVCRIVGIDKDIFWRNPRPSQPSDRTGENTVCAKTINAIVGAVLLHHGEQKAKDFVSSQLLKGPYSVVPVTSKLYIRAGATR
jgi:large subunit ribosomal protein L15